MKKPPQPQPLMNGRDPATMADIRLSQRVTSAWNRASIRRRAACLRLINRYHATGSEGDAHSLIVHLTHPHVVKR